MSENKRNRVSREHIALGAVLTLGLGFRLIRLGTFSFWHDEAFCLLVSEDLGGLFLRGNLAANHPPLAYILLALWRLLGMGVNEWTIRGLPALFGVLGIGAIYLLGKELFNARVGLVAALLLAISPFHVLHSQDLKEYIYLPFFATLMVLYFYRATNTGRSKDWLMYGLLAGICCYTEAFVAPLLVAINCWFLLFFYKHKDNLRYWVGANLLGALMFAPWLGMMLQKVHLYMVEAEGWWVPPPTPWGVVFYFKTIAFGYAAVKPFFYLAFLLFLVLFIYGAYRALVRDSRAALLLLMWAVLPVAMVYVISLFGQSVFLIRALLPYALAVYVLVAVGIVHIPGRYIRYAVVSAVVVLCCVGLGAYYLRIFHPNQHPHRPGTHPPRAYAEAAAYVLEQYEPGDVVVHASGATWLPFFWYGFRDRHPQYLGAHNAKFSEIIRSANPVNTDDPQLLRLWPRMMESVTPGHGRVWFIFSEWEREFLAGQAMRVYRWLDSRYQEVGFTQLKGIDILLYLTPEHPDYRHTVKRDEDTGVTALLQYADRDGTYKKMLPDAGVVPSSVAERRGRLSVQFDDGQATAKEESVKNDSGDIVFLVTNTSDVRSSARMHVVFSDKLVLCAAFTRNELTSSAWNYTPQYNIHPPPPHYDLAALEGTFTDSPASVRYTVDLPHGTYVPLLFATLPFDYPDWQLAPVSVMTYPQGHYMFPQPEVMATPRWTWVAGNAVEHVDESSMTLQIKGYPQAENLHAHANLGYIAFVNMQHMPDSAVAPGGVIEPWKDNVQLPPGGSQRFTVPENEGHKRVDIWVYEQGEDGKGYHIFKTLK